MYKRIQPAGGVSVKTLAEKINGTLYGDPEVAVFSLCSLADPQADGVSFLADKRHGKLDSILQTKPVAALILSESFSLPENPAIPLIAVKNPLHSVIDLIPQFYSKLVFHSGISEKADIATDVVLGSGVSIGAFSVIGEGCKIGNNVTIHPHVTLYPGVILEDGCTIHSGAIIREYCHLKKGCTIQNGAVIGSDGFGYTPHPAHGLLAVPQVGIAVLDAGVDVGANSCIDRGALGSTEIGTGTKIDNLVQVGHNVKMGHHNILCGQTGIAGSTVIGNQCVFGGAVGVGDHLTITDNCRFAGRSAVERNVHESGDYKGGPVIPIDHWRRREVATMKLPELLKDVRAMKKYIKDDHD